MSFGQGLSGLNAASQNLDVIGNNIANAGTIGFKSSTVSFADVYANSRVGLGVQVSGVNQRFSIGNVSTTGNQFDMAIDGAKGLFRLEQPNGAVVYSRNGEFGPNKEGYLVNAQGFYLTGYGPGTNTVQRIRVPEGNIAPKATENMRLQMNMPANAVAIDATTRPFDRNDEASYTQAFNYNVYDSLGNSHIVTQYYIKREANAAGNSEWDIHYYMGDNAISVSNPADPNTPLTSHKMEFDTAGRILPASELAKFVIAQPGGANSPAASLEFEINYQGSTQFGGGFNSGSPFQDGYGTGEYAGMSVTSEGTIVAAYTNGENMNMGAIVLANFTNLQGLQNIGGNAWVETGSSGQPVLGRPGESGLATIKGQAVEESNVDMGQELVNMIVAQRTYQANAQTIKTQDQMLQTLVTLR
ncbi:flagellar hook protein FlgE [Alcaligenes endophyticus]|uniref:Flagellar hook protein FlgE n=1 Tax=Alcaligenes endophyticus TaxID=1929088 RepID=A0ABT8ELC0_9BURK|nr:flagellar hook protein FlgE [Alcaligenes endophyticus]MCX5590551.1 flagellar hook protein FlgE [Alcaligenes endophyticus]MDN4122085.1 flagellar hook protein FlgE [Alcaligenes endophyticus]